MDPSTCMPVVWMTCYPHLDDLSGLRTCTNDHGDTLRHGVQHRLVTAGGTGRLVLVDNNTVPTCTSFRANPWFFEASEAVARRGHRVS
jgi:hypothetical protein